MCNDRRRVPKVINSEVYLELFTHQEKVMRRRQKKFHSGVLVKQGLIVKIAILKDSETQF